MTFLAPEQAKRALEGSSNLLNRLVNTPIVILEQKLSNRSSTVNIDDNTKKLVLETAFSSPSLSNKDVGERFGLSAETISGIRTGGKDKNESVEVKVLREQKMEQASDVAVSRMMQTLGLISQEKLEDCNAKDLSAVASNMAKIVNNLRGKDRITDNRTQIVIFSPQQREEHAFAQIEI